MTPPSLLDEARVLAEALDVSHASITLHSREPLGAGSVTGLRVDDADSLLYYVDTSKLPVPAETGLADADDTTATRIWLHPADPHLPALAPVAFDHAAHTLLARLGIPATGAPSFVGYRPGRRAVLRVPSDDGDIWVKVVRPSRVAHIVQAHTAAEDAGVPLPKIHGWSNAGLIVMAAARGIPAADYEWKPAALLDQVDALREQFRSVRWAAPARSAARRMSWYADRGGDAVTRLLPRTRALFERASDHPRHPPTVVHGDLHYGQLFLDGDGTITSVIDIDTLGIADPSEDAAAFLSHAIASARITRGANRARVWALADLAAERSATDELVRALTTVHLIGHLLAAVDRGDSEGAVEIEAVAESLLAGMPPSSGEAKNPLTHDFESP